MLSAVDGQLAVRSQAVTRGSTPEATLFELTLFRKFVATSLATESCGERVTLGVTGTDKESNLDRCPKSFRLITARMTHITWLVNLAPEIQEAMPFLPHDELGSDPVREIDVRRIARVMDWGLQRGISIFHRD